MSADSVYPGRLYVYDFPALRASGDCVFGFAVNHQVACIIKTHIEMITEPGVDCQRVAFSHPNGYELELGTEHLLELREAQHGTGEEMRYDFIRPSMGSG